MALKLGPMKMTAADPAGAVEGYMVDPMQAPGPVRFNPGPTMEREEAWSPSVWAILDGVLGGDTITEARRGEIARHQALQDDAEMRDLIAGLRGEVLGEDPRELLTYLTNPKAWAENVGKIFGPETLGEGETRVQPGYEPVTTPKTGVAGDTYYVQSPAGVREQGRRRPSYAEVQAAETARANQVRQQQELAARIAHWSNQDATARARVGSARGGTAATNRPAPPPGFRRVE